MKKGIKPNLSNVAIERGQFTYFSNLLFGEGNNSKCFYGFDTISGKEVAIKFELNQKQMINFNQEGIIINKLSDVNFFPKLYNFNCENNKEYLCMSLMGPVLC